MARVKKTGYELKSRGTSLKGGVRVSIGTSVLVAVRVEKTWHELKSRGTSCFWGTSGTTGMSVKAIAEINAVKVHPSKGHRI